MQWQRKDETPLLNYKKYEIQICSVEEYIVTMHMYKDEYV